MRAKALAVLLVLAALLLAGCRYAVVESDAVRVVGGRTSNTELNETP